VSDYTWCIKHHRCQLSSSEWTRYPDAIRELSTGGQYDIIGLPGVES